MKYELHTHSILSDGAALPIEMVRHQYQRRGEVIAITDHVSSADVDHVIVGLKKDCKLAERYWNIVAIPGVEITHVPPFAIRKIARHAKNGGADLVVVHGETIMEPVMRGTNRAAIECPEVDILAHPGLLTPEDAALAAEHGTFIELTARAGHCLTNGHTVRIGLEAGVSFLITSDAHAPSDLLSTAEAKRVGRGAGLSKRATKRALSTTPKELLRRIDRRVV